MNTNYWPIIGFVLLLLSLAACAALDSGIVLPDHHPLPAYLGQEPLICTDCHEERNEILPFRTFNHDASWLRTHRQRAYQNENICSLCHQASFCNDCHAVRVELKPSLNSPDKTYRQMQHRGDYLSRHRIDGRLDPTSCRRCHGNPKTSKTCIPCHG
jgi:hypothetical protein